ncbi:MAG TPA: DNA-3-methyladenine glycosylase 2 family protein [Blastocatellia bacterium]|nr:DNA-3-methyladenine glycosylase 2 family protein [Blastocatellia bacterium]
MPKPLTAQSLLRAVRRLAATDADLAWILKTFGPPPLWQRTTGFATLVHIILEQQVSLASARAAFDRLGRAVTLISPEHFLTLSDAELKLIGFSRQKMRYCRLLAQALLDGQLDLTEVERMNDDAARAALMQITGIGHWTVDIYLLMALRRPDVWPKGDLALAVAMQRLRKLASRPSPDELAAMAENWRPHRAVAARMLWHYYLSTKA